MYSQKNLKKLIPKNWGSFDVEPFTSYQKRAKALLPNWPDCVLEQWLYRHYSDAVRVYGRLGFDKFFFQLLEWSNKQIYEQINSHKIGMIDSQGSNIFKTTEKLASWLQKYFAKEGTWPVPIIILDNKNGILGPNLEQYGTPYHLLEGHLRLGYFRNIYRLRPWDLKQSHCVWVVSKINTEPNVQGERYSVHLKRNNQDNNYSL